MKTNVKPDLENDRQALWAKILAINFLKCAFDVTSSVAMCLFIEGNSY